jgi:hypothetical protein
VSRAQAAVYLVAWLGWVGGFLFVVMSDGATDGPLETFVGFALAPALFVSCLGMWVVAVMRVQRGEVAAEQQGVIGPIAAEFLLMSFGARLPLAFTSLRHRSLG